ncbi:MAG: glycosyltransferase family 9 protein [Phaeospirillum sp.]|nr:glycosyltransferase family 9 protein [Phaeospirillum sp.]
MNFSLMRRVDRYAGAVILLALRPIIALSNMMRRSRMLDPEMTRTVLIEKFFGIGSIVNLTPTIDALRGHYPNAKIIFITFTEQRDFLNLTGIVDEVICINAHDPLRFIVSTMTALFRLWRTGVDVCVDAEFFSKFSATVSSLSGARVRVGFFAYYNSRSPLLTHPVSFNHYVHISRSFLALAETLGAPLPAETTSVTLPRLSGSYDTELKAVWPEIDDGPYALINCNISALSIRRSWPMDRFAKLIRQLVANHPDHRFVLIGAPSERPRVETLLRMAGHCGDRVVNIAGRTSFGGLMKLIERASLLITNDSGPAHIAAGYGIPEVVLFGPETPVLYRPLNSQAVSLYVPPYCSPCLSVLDNKRGETCNDILCMAGISIESVCAAVDPILRRSMAAPTRAAIP